MHPLNDLAKIEVDSDLFGFGGEERKGSEGGILRELPDELLYFGFQSFAFENSLVNKKALEYLYNYYKKLIGKWVSWTEYAERGSVRKEGNKTFAYVKLTALIAASDDENGEDYSVTLDNGGSWNPAKL